VSVDVFDKPETCRKVWDRLLSGVVFDAMEAEQTEEQAYVADVEWPLQAAVVLAWEQTPAIGDGQEYRASSPQGDHASLLILDGAVVHGSVLAV
jgi:hypothetical protein